MSLEAGCPLAVLNVPPGDDACIAYASNVYNAVNLANLTFPNMTPTLPIFLAAVTAYSSAQIAVGTKAVGTVSARNARRVIVRQYLRHWRDGVQAVAELQTTIAAATAVIESAHMTAKQRAMRIKAELAAKDGAVSGAVLLIARAVGKSATYYWSFSLDGKSWTSVPDTMKARTSITGLQAGQTYYFRFSALTRKGPVGYSQVISHLVK